MAPNKIYSQRSLLQRRKSLTTTFQALVDGLIVLFTLYYALINVQGYISTIDAVFTITLLAVMGVTYDQMGIYRQFGGLIKSARKLFFAWSISFAITLFIFLMSSYFDELSRPALSAVFMICFAGQLVNRWFLVSLRVQSAHARNDEHPVLVIGGGPLAKHLYDNINGNPWIQEKAIGRIQVSEQDDDFSIPILGQKEDLLKVVRDNRVTTVYIAVSLAGLPLLTLSESPLIGNHLLFKAVEDRVLALVSLLLFSPLMIIIAVLIKLESPGPVIFRQSRTGWNGKEFPIWKFRSMKLHKVEDGDLKQATKDDERFTRIGRFIRKTSLDELPQLFNVLAGSMSMVGPRPHAIQHNSEYDKRIRAYMTRHRIKPGITGLAQINGYRGETDTLDKMKMRVEFDMQYINNWSFWLDIEILLKTLPALLRNQAY